MQTTIVVPDYRKKAVNVHRRPMSQLSRLQLLMLAAFPLQDP